MAFANDPMSLIGQFVRRMANAVATGGGGYTLSQLQEKLSKTDQEILDRNTKIAQLQKELAVLNSIKKQTVADITKIITGK